MPQMPGRVIHVAGALLPLGIELAVRQGFPSKRDFLLVVRIKA